MTKGSGLRRAGELRRRLLGGLRGRLEHLPAAAQRLVELHAVEQQPGLAVVGAEPHRQPRALRVEQRQQVDLSAVVQRLRTPQRRFGGRGGRLQRLRALPPEDSATSAFSTSSSARTMPSSARSSASRWPASAMSLIAWVRPALKIGIASSAPALR